MKSTNNPSPSPVAILWPPPLCVAWLRPAPPGCSAPPQRRGSETRSRCRTKGRNLKKNHGVLVKMLEFIAIYPIFLVKMGLFYHDLSGRFDPIFLAMSRGFCSEFTSQNLGFFRIYGWFAAPFLDDFQFFRIFFYIFKHHRWIFPSIFPKIKWLGLIFILSISCIGSLSKRRSKMLLLCDCFAHGKTSSGQVWKILRDR